MNAIFGYLEDMIPYMILSLPAILIYRYVYYKIRKDSKVNMYHEIGVICFLLFLTALFSQTIIKSFPIGSSVTYSFNQVNLKPFQVLTDNYDAISLNIWQPFIINFLGNICIFIPIGFMAPLLWNKLNRTRKIALIGFGISLFIETTQLSQNRSSDIDDLWLNTLGSLIGYGLYVVTNKIFPQLTLKFKKVYRREIIQGSNM